MAAEVDPAFLHDIGIWGGEGNDLHVFFHEHRLNPDSGIEDDFGTMFRADAATGGVIERHEGFIWNDPAARETSALRQFFVDLDVQLHLPSPWGLILTGIFGLMMMAAVISGVLMHRHLVRDIFVAERPGDRLVSARDRHVLAASWGDSLRLPAGFHRVFLQLRRRASLPLVAAVAFSLAAIRYLAAADPKRRRAFRQPEMAERWPELALALVVVPGVLVLLVGGVAGFVVWFGATAILGWLLVGVSPARMEGFGRL